MLHATASHALVKEEHEQGEERAPTRTEDGGARAGGPYAKEGLRCAVRSKNPRRGSRDRRAAGVLSLLGVFRAPPACKEG